ncbi:hypothetical protein [Deinococcus radiophilus]
MKWSGSGPLRGVQHSVQMVFGQRNRLAVLRAVLAHRPVGTEKITDLLGR